MQLQNANKVAKRENAFEEGEDIIFESLIWQSGKQQK